jgi:Ras-related protein Rab-1A
MSSSSTQKEDSSKNNKEDKNNFPKLTRINEYQPNHNYIFRICLLGDSAVGKTSLLTRYCDETFKEKYGNTIGVDFRVVTLKCENTIAKIHIWDTAGQERFKSIAVNYFKSSHGFIFVYDITNSNSFINVKNWIELAFANNKITNINFLVGNKSDLESERQVSVNDGEELAKMRNFTFFETSAKENKDVKKMFEFFAYRLIQYYNSNKNEYSETQKDSKTITKSEDINTKRENERNCKC